MKYKISHRYCWYEDKTMIVKMYFINEVPFTFDELPEYVIEDDEIVNLANNNNSYNPEDLYRSSFYLIDEEAHPCLFPVDLENPEDMPPDNDWDLTNE